jgi:hypothetical protein
MRYWFPARNGHGDYTSEGRPLLTGIGAVKISLGRRAVVGGSDDLFPNQSFEIKDIHVRDHPAFGHKTAALRMKRKMKGSRERIERRART